MQTYLSTGQGEFVDTIIDVRMYLSWFS